MVEIKINRDPREYKDKVIAGLSMRQLICAGLMLLINIPLYIFGSEYLGKDITGYLIIAAAIPLVLIGFFEYNKMPFEKVIIAYINSQMIRPAKRKYRNTNIIKIMDDYIIKEEILNREKAKKNKKKFKFKK